MIAKKDIMAMIIGAEIFGDWQTQNAIVVKPLQIEPAEEHAGYSSEAAEEKESDVIDVFAILDKLEKAN